MKMAAQLLAGPLLLLLCAGCLKDFDEGDFDPEFNPEREVVSFCKEMEDLAAGFSKKTEAEQTKASSEVKQALLSEGRKQDEAVAQVAGIVCKLSSGYERLPAARDMDAASRLKAQACQKAAWAARASVLHLVSDKPPLLDLAQRCLNSPNEETRNTARKILDEAGAITALASALERNADSFKQGAETYDQFCRQSCVGRLLSLMSKERRLLLFERAAARSDVRMMGSVKARLTKHGSVPTILDIAEVHQNVQEVASNYCVPLYRERFYKYSEERWLATIIEDTWICVYLLPCLPEQRAADPEHKERWEEVVKRLKPAILELTDPRESFLRNRLKLLADAQEKVDAADAKDLLRKLPALERLAEELRADDEAQVEPVAAPAPPPNAPPEF